jgi:hypothetical protein
MKLEVLFYILLGCVLALSVSFYRHKLGVQDIKERVVASRAHNASLGLRFLASDLALLKLQEQLLEENVRKINTAYPKVREIFVLVSHIPDTISRMRSK